MIDTPQTRWFSLRHRLLGWLLVGIILGWLLAVGFAYVEVYYEVLVELREIAGTSLGKLERKAQEELIEHLVVTMVAPLLLGVPLFGGWIWWVTRRSLVPVTAIAEAVASRSPDQLDPVVPSEAPTEIRPLIEAMNAQFARLGELLEKERRFTADAAHELRTPLAALVAQVQVAQRAANESERRHALQQVQVVAQRMSRLVDQLLTLARLEPETRGALEAVRLDELARAVCADYGGMAIAKGVMLTLAASTPTTVAGNADLLRVLLRNLIDNAIRYTPADGEVEVEVTASDTEAILTVRDSGPGIPPAERADVLRRFYRLAGQEVEGSGLGLAIVARIVALHGAELILGEGLPRGTAPGLSVQVVFADRRR